MLNKIDLEVIVDIAKEAGDAIIQIYDKDFKIEYKDDKSPLTEADTRSNEIICQALEKFYPGIPLLSEENKEVAYEIDGTKEFIKKNGEFTVNIALIHKNTPVLGVVYAPALGDIYKAKKGEGAFKNNQKLPLKTNETPEKLLSKGSSLKLVMVAEGSADIYPRLAPTMEWDTAAADAIVRESGKMTYQFDSNIPVVYNKENLLNPWFIVSSKYIRGSI